MVSDVMAEVRSRSGNMPIVVIGADTISAPKARRILDELAETMLRDHVITVSVEERAASIEFEFIVAFTNANVWASALAAVAVGEALSWLKRRFSRVRRPRPVFKAKNEAAAYSRAYEVLNKRVHAPEPYSIQRQEWIGDDGVHFDFSDFSGAVHGCFVRMDCRVNYRPGAAAPAPVRV